MSNFTKANIMLNKNNCYFEKHGACSLDIVGDFSLTFNVVDKANHLLYCPNLLKLMQKTEVGKPISVIECACGHLQVFSGHQRCCIASKTGLPLDAARHKDEVSDMCPVCGGQVTFYKEANCYRLVDADINLQ